MTTTCNSCKATIPDDLYRCPYCKELQTAFNYRAAPKRRGFPKWLIVIAIIGAAVFMLLRGGDGSSSTASEGYQVRMSWQSACRFAQGEMKARLKAPATAEFPPCQKAMVSQTGAMADVISWVDAQNSFGAMIRTGYRASLLYAGGQWRLNELVTDED